MVNAIIFDWAGTLIDTGSMAPVAVFSKVFEDELIEVSLEECRAPMGISKRAHIAEMLAMPRINKTFVQLHDRQPHTNDLDRMYERFLRINESVVLSHVTPIAGALETFSYLRKRNIKIGSTSGYGRALMTKIIPLAAEFGLVVDTVVCGDDLAEGRPSPLMMYRCFADLGVYPSETVIKVDDTCPGILEAVAAGSKAVGITLTGNAVGMSEAELDVLSQDQKEELHQMHAAEFFQAGAEHVIKSVAELPALLDRLG